MGVVPDGGEKLAALSRALRAAGEKGLDRELDRGVREPLQALIPDLKDAQREVMPKRGGMADRAAAVTKFSVRRRNTGRYPGVRLVASQPGRIRRQDQGRLRHPVFADQSEPRESWEWTTQQIPSGWFTGTTREHGPAVGRSVDQALDHVARQIEIDVGRA